MERVFDILFSILAILILLPLFVVVIILLKFTGENQVFFLQKRVGKNGKYFKLIKFATMLKDSPQMNSGTITIKNDPRILPFGKFLRISKINELPQLLNIIKGDMSIIGPRPLTKQTFDFYQMETKKQILKVRPGLSGIGSIIFRKEEDLIDNDKMLMSSYYDSISSYKGKLEQWFVVNKNLYIYFVLIILTLWVVIYPSSKMVWRIFSTLPKPPKELKNYLNF